MGNSNLLIKFLNNKHLISWYERKGSLEAPYIKDEKLCRETTKGSDKYLPRPFCHLACSVATWSKPGQLIQRCMTDSKPEKECFSSYIRILSKVQTYPE